MTLPQYRRAYEFLRNHNAVYERVQWDENAAGALATTILADEGQGDRHPMEVLFRRVLSRSPRPGEMNTMMHFLADCRENYRQNPEEAAQLLTVGMHAVPPEVDKIELASWTDVCRAMLNLNETVTRN